MLRSVNAKAAPPSSAIHRQPVECEVLDLAEVTEAVATAAKGLRYGSIEIVVHEGRVVQIVRTEKRRILR
jgi:hypothetical protein